MKKKLNFYEEIDLAVKNGDCEALIAAYENNADLSLYRGVITSGYSSDVLAATLNKARKDPDALQQDMLMDMLALQRMLFHRGQIQLKRSIQEHDASIRGQKIWGDLPSSVTDELLPRLGRLCDEIRSTIETIRKLKKRAHGE